MQRVRIGLTGLAFVFLLVLMGAIFARPHEEDSAANIVGRLAAGNGAAPTGVALNEGQPKEPLAELGVAPGNADQNGTQAPAR